MAGTSDLLLDLAKVTSEGLLHYMVTFNTGQRRMSLEVQLEIMQRPLLTYREAAAIADRLAKADPNNAGWQRDLSVSYAKLANAYRTAGQLRRQHVLAAVVRSSHSSLTHGWCRS